MAAVFLVGAGMFIAAVMFAAIGLPIVRGRARPARDDRAETLSARLAEIESDRASGLIADTDAQSAIIEAQRATLSMSAEAAPVNARKFRFAAVLFLALAPLAAVLVYINVGAPALSSPKTPSQARALDPNVIAAMPEDERRAMIERMVASLAARLDAAPADADGWRMLARSELVLQRPVDSAASYRRLFALQDGTLEDWRNFATALTAVLPAGKFPSDPEFLAALGEIESRAPGDAMALFYRGGAARENGDARRAVELWSQLLAAMPADAPVRGTLETLIEEARADIPAPEIPE